MALMRREQRDSEQPNAQPVGPAVYRMKTSTTKAQMLTAPLICSGITAGSFGAVAGIFALFFFSDVPKVRVDIMQVGEARSDVVLG